MQKRLNTIYCCHCGKYFEKSSDLLIHIRLNESPYHYAIQDDLQSVNRLFQHTRGTENENIYAVIS
ncbi:MAG TPA: hypothetical protein QF753_20720 [Victivallales bacterium]|nr:hypothetical protein [Victivallales bacterium]